MKTPRSPLDSGSEIARPPRTLDATEGLCLYGLFCSNRRLGSSVSFREEIWVVRQGWHKKQLPRICQRARHGNSPSAEVDSLVLCMLGMLHKSPHTLNGILKGIVYHHEKTDFDLLKPMHMENSLNNS